MADTARRAVSGSRLRISCVTGVPEAERRPEIAARDAGQERAVLRQQRPVEAERRPQPRDFIGRGAFPEHRLRGITGHEVDQREHERRDAEQHRHGQQQAAQEVSSRLHRKEYNRHIK